jgi:diacylglycerol kinase (ATP)
MNFAIEGILHAARTQRHIRYHLFAAMLLLLSCFSLGINREEFIILAIVAMIVIVSEMFNSVIEELVDIVSPRKNEHARIIKDMAAGAVLLTASVALIVAYFLRAVCEILYQTRNINREAHLSRYRVLQCSCGADPRHHDKGIYRKRTSSTRRHAIRSCAIAFSL